MADVFDSVDVLATPMTAIPAFAAEGPMPREILGQRVHAGMSVPPGDSREPLGFARDPVLRCGSLGCRDSIDHNSWPTATAKTCACDWPASWSRPGRGRSERRRADGAYAAVVAVAARAWRRRRNPTPRNTGPPTSIFNATTHSVMSRAVVLSIRSTSVGRTSVEDLHGLTGVLGPGVHPFGLGHLYDVATRGCEPHLVARRRDDDCGRGLDPSGSAPAFTDLQVHDHGRDHEAGDGDRDSSRDPLLRAAAQGLGRERRLLLRAGPGAHHGRHRAGGAGRAALDGGGDAHLVVAVPEPFVAEHVVGRGDRLEPPTSRRRCNGHQDAVVFSARNATPISSPPPCVEAIPSTPVR